MERPEQALAQRIRELRRRHFGAHGKEEFARRLGITLQEYERYERGVLPPGDLMVRMCEVTGEDLQWLLTGVAGRGTVVIAGTRGRHQQLLARLARMLDEHPEWAAPVEAFIDLLSRTSRPPSVPAATLPPPTTECLIPLFEPHELPLMLPNGGPERFDLSPFTGPQSRLQRCPVHILEPAMRYEPPGACDAELLAQPGEDAAARYCVYSRQVAACLPGAFGVWLREDAMRPMFAAGDALLVMPGVGAKVGRPALCRVAGMEPTTRCRIWLGEEGDVAHLGRLADGETEQVPREQLLWSLEVLYRVARAA